MMQMRSLVEGGCVKVLTRPTESCADSEEPLEQIKPEERMYIADAPTLFAQRINTRHSPGPAGMVNLSKVPLKSLVFNL